MKKISGLFKAHYDVIMYLIIGICTTGINWTAYAVLSAADIGITSANALAWIIAVIFAFFANKLIVFNSRSFFPDVVLPEAAKFLCSRAFTGLIEIFLPLLLFTLGLDMPLFGIDGAAAKITASVVVIIINYIFGKLIVFTKKDYSPQGNHTQKGK